MGARRFNGTEGWIVDSAAADGRVGVRVGEHLISVCLESLQRLPMVATPPRGGETSTLTSRIPTDVAEDTSRVLVDIAEDGPEWGPPRCSATAESGAADEP